MRPTVMPAVAGADAAAIVITASVPSAKHDAPVDDCSSARRAVIEGNICFAHRSVTAHAGCEVPAAIEVTLFHIRQDSQHPTRPVKSSSPVAVADYIQRRIACAAVTNCH